MLPHLYNNMCIYISKYRKMLTGYLGNGMMFNFLFTCSFICNKKNAGTF